MRLAPPSVGHSSDPMNPAQIFSACVNDPSETSADVEMNESDVVDSDVFDLVTRHGSDVAFAPGAQISDSIRLVSLLGTGGMGNAWGPQPGRVRKRGAGELLSRAPPTGPARRATLARRDN